MPSVAIRSFFYLVVVFCFFVFITDPLYPKIYNGHGEGKHCNVTIKNKTSCSQSTTCLVLPIQLSLVFIFFNNYFNHSGVVFFETGFYQDIEKKDCIVILKLDKSTRICHVHPIPEVCCIL